MSSGLSATASTVMLPRALDLDRLGRRSARGSALRARRDDNPCRADERLERHARRRLVERLLGQERHVDEAAARLRALLLEARIST